MSSAPRYPSTQPLRIVTSPLQARTKPGRGRLLRSVTWHQDTDNLSEGIMMLGEPEGQVTQEEQDADDEKARKQAMRNLINSWQERLQLISVITTFFASTEAAMLVNSKPDGSSDFRDTKLMATNACLLGALLLHVYASVLSFLGAFLLISYKLKEATREEMIVEGIKTAKSPFGRSMINDVEQGASDPGLQRTLTNGDVLSTVRKSTDNGKAKLVFESNKQGSHLVRSPAVSSNPHNRLVGPFMSRVSSHLFLSRTHALCVFLAATGFILAIAGIMCYVWDTQPIAVCVFASTCLGGSMLAMGVLLI